MSGAGLPFHAPAVVSEGVGLRAASLMVVGNIVGSGVFLVPQRLASVGSWSTVGWALSMVGVSCLALVYAKLSSLEYLDAEGGSYSFARRAYGPRVGYFINAIYVVSVCFGNVAGTIVGVSFAADVVSMSTETVIVLSVVVIWLMTAVNCVGAPVVARVQSACTLMTLLPIAIVGGFGWLIFVPEMFWLSWEPSVWHIHTSLNAQLYAFTGLETASAVASLVRNPKHDLPAATGIGVLVAGAGYISSCTVLLGIMSKAELEASRSPFSHAVRLLAGNTAAALVALCALVGCVGSTAGWMLVASKSARAAAEDGLFPRFFATTNSRGVNQTGLLVLSLVMTLMCLGAVTVSSSTNTFDLMSSLSSILTMAPYLCTALSLPTLVRGGTNVTWRVIALTAIAYCVLALLGSPASHLLLAAFCAAAVLASYRYMSPTVVDIQNFTI